MRNRKKTSTFKQKSYVIAAVIMLIAAFGMTGIYYSQQNKKQAEQIAKEETEAQQLAAAEKKAEAARKAQQKTEEEAKKQETEAVSGIIPPENNDFMDEPEVVAKDDTQVQPKVTELHFNAADLKWPLQGNVIMNYSMDQTIYFQTLDQYKYNPAIVIQAEVNTPVDSVAQGKITAIENNAETGTTVTVDLGDGYSAVYGQLKEVSKKIGDSIESEEVLGYVSEPTKYFSVEGSNLYFELIKDGSPVNPMEYLE